MQSWLVLNLLCISGWPQTQICLYPLRAGIKGMYYQARCKWPFFVLWMVSGFLSILSHREALQVISLQSFDLLFSFLYPRLKHVCCSQVS